MLEIRSLQVTLPNVTYGKFQNNARNKAYVSAVYNSVSY